MAPPRYTRRNTKPGTPERATVYRREEEARNRRAREQHGFTTRAQLRRALRQGYEPVRKTPGNPRSPIVGPPPKGGGGPPPAKGLKGLARLRSESRSWSVTHSRKITSRYYPSFTADETRRYHAAFVDPRTNARRIENELASLRVFLVDTMGFYTDETFDDRYGTQTLPAGVTMQRGIVQHD